MNSIERKTMKQMMKLLAVWTVFAFAGQAQADVVGNKASKFFFPENCFYAKLIKKDNVMNFKTAADAQAAGYKASSKCKDAAAMAFVGNKSSKFFFPANCSYVKLIKDENKVNFKSAAEAMAAGYKASSKCADDQ